MNQATSSFYMNAFLILWPCVVDSNLKVYHP